MNLDPNYMVRVPFALGSGAVLVWAASGVYKSIMGIEKWPEESRWDVAKHTVREKVAWNYIIVASFAAGVLTTVVWVFIYFLITVLGGA